MPRRRNPGPKPPANDARPPIQILSQPAQEPPDLPSVLFTVLSLVALGAVVLTVQSVLSPFVVLAGAVFLLYPYRDNVLVRRSLVLAGLLVGLWTFTTLFAILVPFLFAYLLSYIFDPIVTRLADRNIPRWASSAVIVLLFVGGIIAIVMFVLPLVIVQFDGILSGFRTLQTDATTWLESGHIAALLESVGIPAASVRATLQSQLLPRVEGIMTGLVEGMLGLVSGITSVALHIINAIIIPFMVFYLLKDFPAVTVRFYQAFPEGHRQNVRSLIARLDGVLGGYFRGAVIVAIIQGTISATVLWLIGVNYALVLGVMTAVLNFIPYVGLVTSLVVASMVALFSGEPVLTKVIGVVILYLSQKLLEATVLGPKIIGPQVGLHPVVLILCLMVFGYFLGFVGLLIAVPATALLLLAWDSVEAKRTA